MKLTEYIAITLNEKTCLSVFRRRQCPTERGRPVGDRAVRPAEQNSQNVQIRTLLDKQKSKFLPSARQKSTDTNFKPLMTEEVYEN